MLAVEQVRGRIPDIAHIIYAELVSGIVFAYEDMAFVGRCTYLDVTYAGVFQNLLDFFLVLIADLDNDTRIFSE